MADSRHITRRAAIVGALTLSTAAAASGFAPNTEIVETDGARIQRLAGELSTALTDYDGSRWQMFVRPDQNFVLQPWPAPRDFAGVPSEQLHRAYFAYLQNERQILARQMYGIGHHQEALRFTPMNTGFDLMGNRIGWNNLINAKGRAEHMLAALGVQQSDFF